MSTYVDEYREKLGEPIAAGKLAIEYDRLARVVMRADPDQAMDTAMRMMDLAFLISEVRSKGYVEYSRAVREVNETIARRDAGECIHGNEWRIQCLAAPCVKGSER